MFHFMKKVYTSPNIGMVGHIKNILAANGIDSEIQGEHRVIGSGGIPTSECWPELWILDESQLEKAEQIVAEALESVETKVRDWKCPGCGEEVEGQFTECWNCGKERPDNI